MRTAIEGRRLASDASASTSSTCSSAGRGVRGIRGNLRTRNRHLQPARRGLLTGRYRFESDATPGRIAAARGAKEYRDRYWHEDLFEAVEKLHGIADAAGLGLPELALRWCVSRPVVDAVLLGGSSEKHLRSNLAAIQAGPLPEDVLAACDEVGADLRGPMPAYNR
ncbi:aldo/keto reductase [Paramicrobacterium humi]|uniref:aldo/keto reductase n=1 Tax=Paramicrobacterium humi TaxID=640635 RepID=UPI001C40A2F4|nr:aldo/keto reductase [Microbacterium humi]